jgi:hypothetical protein
MSLGATLVASLLATLSQPATWPLALAAFLVRGGILLVAAPIVVVPSAVGVANVITPTVSTFVFGGVSGGLVALVLGTFALSLGWLILGGLFASAAELEVIARIARDDAVSVEAHVGTKVVPSRRTAARILAARLVAHLPTVVALVWAAARLGEVAYRELTQPLDVSLPLVVRVIGGAPEATTAVLLAWVLGEMVGAIAARRVAFGDAGVWRAIGGGLRRVVLHPVRAVALYGIPTTGLLVVLVPSAFAAASGWDAVRVALTEDVGLIVTILTLTVFVGLWAGGLVLASAMTAWRAAAWTVDAVGLLRAIPDPATSREAYAEA